MGNQFKTLSLASYDKFHDLRLNENMFIILAGSSGFCYDFDRTSGNTTPFFEYDHTNGILTYCAHYKTSPGYWHYCDFQILIIE